MDQTFSNLGYYGSGDRGGRSWGAALVASSSIYVVAALAIVMVGTATKTVLQEKDVDVTFVEKVALPEPPPPPPVVEVKPEMPPPAAAPVIPKNMKVRKLDKPPPPKELSAPKEMPLAAPKEADPSEDKGIAVYGEPGTGDPAGLEGGAQGGVAGGRVGAVSLPENADPPTALASNVAPSYPDAARADGKTGVVILKIVVDTKGVVIDVQLMRGEEPFASAAIDAVKKWRYQPATYNGQPITVYHVVKIPFKLTV